MERQEARWVPQVFVVLTYWLWGRLSMIPKLKLALDIWSNTGWVDGALRESRDFCRGLSSWKVPRLYAMSIAAACLTHSQRADGRRVTAVCPVSQI